MESRTKQKKRVQDDNDRCNKRREVDNSASVDRVSVDDSDDSESEKDEHDLLLSESEKDEQDDQDLNAVAESGHCFEEKSL